MITATNDVYFPGLVSPSDWVFTTFGGSPPVVDSSSPSHQERDVSTSIFQVDLTFDEPIKSADTPLLITFTLFNRGIQRTIPLTDASVGGDDVDTTDITECLTSTLVEVPIPNDIATGEPGMRIGYTLPANLLQNLVGQHNLATSRYFITRGATWLPVSLSPSHGSSEVSTSTEISLSFEEHLRQPLSFSFSVIDQKSLSSIATITETSATYEITGATSRIILPSLLLESGTSYKMSIPAGSFHLYSDVANPVIEWSFVTDGVISPTLVSLSPNRDSYASLQTDSIRVTFTESVRLSSTSSAQVQVRDLSSQSILYTFSPSDIDVQSEPYSAVFRLPFNLPDSSVYEAIVPGALFESYGGLPFDGLTESWLFKVEGERQPTVTTFSPSLDGLVDTASLSSLSLTFSEVVFQPSLPNTYFLRIHDTLNTMVPPLSIDMTNSEAVQVVDNTISIFLPAGFLRPGTTYHTSIDTASVSNIIGNVFEGVVSWRFSTSVTGYELEVDSLDPTDTFSSVSIGIESIGISFKDRIVQRNTASSLSSSFISIRDSQGNVAVTVPHEDVLFTDNTASLPLPPSSLLVNRAYTVVIPLGYFSSRVSDAGLTLDSGNIQWRFATIADGFECSANPCEHGNCTQLDVGFECDCDPFFTGDLCDQVSCSVHSGSLSVTGGAISSNLGPNGEVKVSVPSVVGGQTLSLSVSMSNSTYFSISQGSSEVTAHLSFLSTSNPGLFPSFSATSSRTCENVVLTKEAHQGLNEYTLTCEVPRGVGGDLHVGVFILPWSSTPSSSPCGFSQDSLSYPPPTFIPGTLTRTGKGDGGVVLSKTTQGDEVMFEGENFALQSSDIEITYGGGQYECIISNLIQLSPSLSRIFCRTAPLGQGKLLTFTATVLNQVSVPSVDTYSYPDAPTIERVSGCGSQDPTNTNRTTGCPTIGDTRITITGKDLEGDITVSVASKLCSDVTRIGDKQFSCLLPEGSGVRQIVSVTLFRDENILLSQPVQLLSYAPPVISRLRSSECILGSVPNRLVDCPRRTTPRITIQGANFGAQGATVLVGTQTCTDVEHGGDETDPLDLKNHEILYCNLQVGFGLSRAVVILQEKGQASNPEGEDVSRVSYKECEAGFFEEGVNCTACAPGTFAAAAGLLECDLCPVGRYMFDRQARECIRCEAGFYQDEEGQLECKQCEKGSFSKDTGAQFCTPCSAGTMSDIKQATVCKECGNGKFQPNRNQSECIVCEPGRYTSGGKNAFCTPCESGTIVNSVQTGCRNCPEGKYQNETGQLTCVNCPPGRASAITGVAECALCLAGTYTPDTQQQLCTQCRKDTVQPKRGQTNCVPCEGLSFQSALGQPECDSCPEREYAQFTGGVFSKCLPCPSDASCNGRGPPEPDSGFFLLAKDKTGTFETLKCQPNLCLTSQDCGPNRLPPQENIMCGRCIENYYEWGGNCVECDGIRWDILISGYLAMFVFVWVVYKTSQSSSGHVKVFMYFVQMAILFVGESVRHLTWLEVCIIIFVSLSLSLPRPAPISVSLNILPPLSYSDSLPTSSHFCFFSSIVLQLPGV